MPDDWPRRFTREALAKVDAYIAAHPGYTRQGVEQPKQGATNRVIYARRDHELVVFKVFCEVERKERECFALRHWQETGLVPELIWDADPRMIVTSHLPGVSLPAAREAYGEMAWREISRYLSYDGTPGSGYAWASPADPAAYRKSMEAAEDLLGIDR